MIAKPFIPRPSQQEVLAYQGGYMGIAAVPGSGKTQVLSALATKLISSGRLEDDQEVLVVTLTNSAVENFRQRIQLMLHQEGLVSTFGYRVRTLHGLSLDIVRERPDLVNLSADFFIIDEDESNEILQQVINAFLPENNDLLIDVSMPGWFESNSFTANDQWRKALIKYAPSFIQQAKDYNLQPDALRQLAYEKCINDAIFLIGNTLYEQYQAELAARNGIDFSDLIRYAYQILATDAGYRERLHRLWPYVLEDEAQDSSRLQENMLRLLVGEHGNWVRVGDRNQAIYETFTTASPEYLTNFIRDPETQSKELPFSGRSTQSVIDLANHLIQWSHSPDISNQALIGSLYLPLIALTPPDDPQQNPSDQPASIFIQEVGLSPDQEITSVVQSAAKWFAEKKDETAAILVPDNIRAAKIVDELKTKGVDVVEMLKTQQQDRNLAELLAACYAHLASPYDSHLVAELYKLWAVVRTNKGLLIDKNEQKSFYDALHAVKRPEQLFYGDNESSVDPVLSQFIQRLLPFSDFVHALHTYYSLSPDKQLLAFIPLVCESPAQVILMQNISRFLKRHLQTHPEWTFKSIRQELNQIANSHSNFKNSTFDLSGFNPDDYRGKVLVATMHRAKGLEWDRVYLMGVNNYDFPLGSKGDVFRGELFFLRDKMNLEAELVKRVNQTAGTFYKPTFDATAAARLQYAAERLRLLYVGITRARKELIITWNTGRDGDMHRAEALNELATYRKQIQDD